MKMNVEDSKSQVIMDRSETPLNFDHWKDYELSEQDLTEIVMDDLAHPVVKKENEKKSGSPNFDKTCKKRCEIPTASRRKKKPRGMPKRPLSSYNIFFQQERVRIISEQKNNPDNLFEELGKIIGKRWKILPDDERKKYDLLAHKDAVRYRKEMEAYTTAKKRRHEEIKNQITEESTTNSSMRLPDMKPLFKQAPVYSQLPDAQEVEPPEELKNQMPIPPGTEVILPDAQGTERRYKVEYKFYTMTMKEAKAYMESLVEKPSSASPEPSPTSPTFSKEQKVYRNPSGNGEPPFSFWG